MCQDIGLAASVAGGAEYGERGSGVFERLGILAGAIADQAEVGQRLGRTGKVPDLMPGGDGLLVESGGGLPMSPGLEIVGEDVGEPGHICGPSPAGGMVDRAEEILVLGLQPSPRLFGRADGGRIRRRIGFGDDELAEITPKSIRLRKRFLKEHERKRADRAAA